jgi:hypothetical protein
LPGGKGNRTSAIFLSERVMAAAIAQAKVCIVRYTHPIKADGNQAVGLPTIKVAYTVLGDTLQIFDVSVEARPGATAAPAVWRFWRRCAAPRLWVSRWLAERRSDMSGVGA